MEKRCNMVHKTRKLRKGEVMEHEGKRYILYMRTSLGKLYYELDDKGRAIRVVSEQDGKFFPLKSQTLII